MKEAINYNSFLYERVAENLSSGKVAVDFGAGSGTFSHLLRQTGVSGLCIEADKGLRERLITQGFRCYSTIDEISIESLDYIYTLNVLEHLEDDASMVKKFYSALKLGGIVLIYVPAFAILYTSMDRKVGHYRRYRRHDLTRMLLDAGFEINRCVYCDSLGFFASLVFKILDNGVGAVNRRALIAYDRLVFPLSRRLDAVVGGWFGKNVLAIATRPR